MTIIGENNWLGTNPIFYHERTGAASNNINDVIDLPSLEFDSDGLRDYLDFGYCVFGRTPVRHVRFAGACVRLVRDASNHIHEECAHDPTLSWHGRTTNELDIIDQIRGSVSTWERSVAGEIILPLSGGFDSRLLGSLLSDTRRIRTFSYGISDDPMRSTEVVIAREAAARFGYSWDHIPLGNFHAFLEPWDHLFGLSTHSNGMYHFAFYTNVAQSLQATPALLSGIVGDAWAGSISQKIIRSANDLHALSYSHGMDARAISCHLKGDGRWRQLFWDRNHDRLCDPIFQCLEIIRLKMMLLRYLLDLPHSLGFRPWSPFTDCSIAMGMLCLPPERRRNRAWQNDYFSRHNLDIHAPTASQQNSLDFRVTKQWPLPLLNSKRLSALFDREAIDSINDTVCRPGIIARVLGSLQTYPKGIRLARRFRLTNPMARAYAAYTTIYPIDQMLRRREMS